jgi:hypothetical protein
MSIELHEPILVRQIERLAAERTEPPVQVLENAVRAYLETVEREAIHAETEAFWAMRDHLLARYPGESVALYQGQVVDHDADVTRLESRVRDRFGSLPVLIAPVTPGPRRDLLWRGGKVG